MISGKGGVSSGKIRRLVIKVGRAVLHTTGI